MSAPNPKNDGRNAFFYLPDKSPEMVKLLLDAAAGEGERGIETALTAVDTESKESLACELASRGESWLIFQQLAEAGWLGHLDLETPDNLGCTPLQKAYRDQFSW